MGYTGVFYTPRRIFSSRRTALLSTLTLALSLGTLTGCGGLFGDSDDDSDGSGGTPLADTYQATLVRTGATETRFTGVINVDDSGNLSGTLDLASPDVEFDIAGTLSADGTLNCTVNAGAENASFYYLNAIYTGNLERSGETWSGAVTGRSSSTSTTTFPATFTIVRVSGS